MAKIEQGEGILLSVDTEVKTLKVQEIRRSESLESPPKKEWELPYSLDWEDEEFFALVGKKVEYVLSDGTVVDLKLG